MPFGALPRAAKVQRFWYRLPTRPSSLDERFYAAEEAMIRNTVKLVAKANTPPKFRSI
jgi:hypothetical protein